MQNAPKNHPNKLGVQHKTKQHFQQTWSGDTKERTSSSPLSLHFGHYIADSKLLTLSHFHALKTTIAPKRGFVLDRWTVGLFCMLEKKPGVSLIADFNKATKEIFGNRMLELVRDLGLIPEDIFRETAKTSDAGALSNLLFCDINRQSIITAPLSSIDAANCYHSIAHTIVSLVL